MSGPPAQWSVKGKLRVLEGSWKQWYNSNHCSYLSLSLSCPLLLSLSLIKKFSIKYLIEKSLKKSSTLSHCFCCWYPDMHTVCRTTHLFLYSSNISLTYLTDGLSWGVQHLVPSHRWSLRCNYAHGHPTLTTMLPRAPSATTLTGNSFFLPPDVLLLKPWPHTMRLGFITNFPCSPGVKDHIWLCTCHQVAHSFNPHAQAYMKRQQETKPFYESNNISPDYAQTMNANSFSTPLFWHLPPWTRHTCILFIFCSFVFLVFPLPLMSEQINT